MPRASVNAASFALLACLLSLATAAKVSTGIHALQNSLQSVSSEPVKQQPRELLEKTSQPVADSQAERRNSRYSSLLRVHSWLRSMLDYKDVTPIGGPGRHLTTWQTMSAVVVLCITIFAAKNTQYFMVIGAIASWTLASVVMNLFNKEAADRFPATCLLVIIQMMITNVTIVFTRWHELHLPTWRDFLRWLPVTLIVAAMLGSSLFAFKGTTVSTVLIFRNVLPIITFAMEKSMFNNPPVAYAGHWLSMATTLCGTVLYGMFNISVSTNSVAVILLGCGLTVLDKLLQRYLLTSEDFKASLAVCMLINNTVGMVPLFFFALAIHEFSHWQTTLLSTDMNTWILVSATGLAGTALGYFGLEVAKHLTAASVLMLQNGAKIFIIGIGVVIFGDDITGLSAAGCCISMLGSAWYGYEAMKSSAPKDTAKDTPKATGQK